jgi:GNAT superfamily N-acetyltransferase
MQRSSLALAVAAGSVSYEIDTDRARLDLAMIHDFLARSHWAKGIPLDVLKKAIDHSLPFGVYRDGTQIGFARVVTDRATFAYLADVFIVPEERSAGVGRRLIDTILAHPELKGMRRWLLGTRDAQKLYRRCGFTEPPPPFAFLEKLEAGIYGTTAEEGPAA